jgi:KDO2-lipid IV(A) lauroyltransferase
MQEKMATRNRVVRALASATSHVWFPGSLLFARSVPRRISYPIARGIGGAYFRLRPKYMKAIRANLSVILGEPTDSEPVRRAAHEMVRGHASAWLDFLHFAARPPEESALLVESVVGFSRLVEGRLKGKGVVLLTAHLGNWEIGGLMLAEVKQPIHVVLVPDLFSGVERVRRRMHARAGVTEITVDRTFLPTLAVLRALDRNGIVAMQGDRDFDNTGIAAPFFGREAYFPRGPFRVAMATGAVVLPAFIVRVPGGRYRAIIEEPLAIEDVGDRDAALRRNIARYVAVLERYVKTYPEQWYCFYPFWDDPSRKAAPSG